jgi:hypothetical protein
MTSRQLTTVLTRTLEVKAEQAMTAGSSPDLRQVAEPPAYSEPRPPAARRRRPLPAAAVVAALAIGAVGAIGLRGDSAEEQVSTTALDDPPDGWLVPTSLPAGMQLWGLEFSAPAASERLSESGTIPQLFGDPDQGRAIYITSSYYDVVPETAEPVTVRRRTGQAGTSWDVAENDVGDAVSWEEQGASITALYKGVTRSEAIGVLDSLHWRSDDPADGFSPPDDEAWALRGEIAGWPPVGHEADFAYSQGVPSASSTDGRPDLWIHTQASSEISAGYLEGLYKHGSETGNPGQPVTNFEEWGRLEIYWSDGRSVIIEPLSGSSAQATNREQLEQVALSLTVAGEADLEALRDQAETNIAALPVVASGETTIGTVEVHGEGSFVRACLKRSLDGSPNCPAEAISGGSGAADRLMTSADWTVDGTWYVVVASTVDHVQILGSEDASHAPDAGELPAETTTAGEWTIYVAAPPPGIDQVCLSDDGGRSIGCSFFRPAAGD